MMPKRILLFFIVLVSMTVTPITGSIPPALAKPPLTLAVVRQQFRNEYIKFETVIDALDIAPGMTVLDIGAGPGYATFLFAEKLQGSGQVFATDIRADFVNYIADEAKRRGLTNVVTALVNGQGFDVFYGKHRYDLVLLSNVYHCLDKRIEYFSKLRAQLKPNARLIFILYNQTPLFSADEFSDFDGLVKSLSRGAEDDPFVRNLSTTTRHLLEDKPATWMTLKPVLVDDFNRMLIDPLFYKNFYSNFYFKKDLLTPSDRDFANWLLMTLNEEGVLERPVDQIDAKAMRTVIKLNRLFFMKRFGGYLSNGGMGAYVPAGDANRHTSKYEMLRELDAAGYKFAKEIKLSPYFEAVIMVPTKP